MREKLTETEFKRFFNQLFNFWESVGELYGHFPKNDPVRHDGKQVIRELSRFHQTLEAEMNHSSPRPILVTRAWAASVEDAKGSNQ